MARSARGAGNILGPMFLVGVAAVIALVAVFAFSDETPPDTPTIIAEESVEADPAGAGTTPDGARDMETEGITDALDEVDPAAPDVEQVPPAEAETPTAPVESNAEPQESGDTAAPAETTGESTTGESFLIDEDSGDGATGDGVTDPAAEGLPAGRDAQTELNPDPDQNIVRDTDDGGGAFVPTPSGPAGRDGETIAE